jgi:hypothetical protein
VIANINTDMVGEGTVKTNSRFYSTRTPDSAPSFLDGLMSDVLTFSSGHVKLTSTRPRGPTTTGQQSRLPMPRGAITTFSLESPFPPPCWGTILIGQGQCMQHPFGSPKPSMAAHPVCIKLSCSCSRRSAIAGSPANARGESLRGSKR